LNFLKRTSHLLDRAAAIQPATGSAVGLTQSAHSAFFTIPPLSFTGNQKLKFASIFDTIPLTIALISKRSTYNIGTKYRFWCSDNGALFIPNFVQFGPLPYITNVEGLRVTGQDQQKSRYISPVVTTLALVWAL